MSNQDWSYEVRKALLADACGLRYPDDEAEVDMLAAVLADPSTWAEPSPGLEDDGVFAVATAPGGRARRARPWVMAAAAGAAAVLVFAVVAALVTRGGHAQEIEARLTATMLAPGANATASMQHNDSGFYVELDAHGLPRLKSGQFYEAWLKNDSSGVSVPIGTFSSSDEQVTLWSGVSPHDYRVMEVTIERADNDQSSSGRTVLAGEVAG